MDTQWPRFEVFVQEKPGAPHQDAGSVHAPDIELALFNARDVFARRPEAVSMWVVPAGAIFSRTAQELEAQPGLLAASAGAAPVEEEYEVCCKPKAAGMMTWVGRVTAGSPEQALARGVLSFSGDQPPFAWWVFPRRQVLASDPEDVDSLFAPAREKTFRLSSDFKTVTAMREITSTAG